LLPPNQCTNSQSNPSTNNQFTNNQYNPSTNNQYPYNLFNQSTNTQFNLFTNNQYNLFTNTQFNLSTNNQYNLFTNNQYNQCTNTQFNLPNLFKLPRLQDRYLSIISFRLNPNPNSPKTNNLLNSSPTDLPRLPSNRLPDPLSLLLDNPSLRASWIDSSSDRDKL
jgi:hypothetical protein